MDFWLIRNAHSLTDQKGTCVLRLVIVFSLGFLLPRGFSSFLQSRRATGVVGLVFLLRQTFFLTRYVTGFNRHSVATGESHRSRSLKLNLVTGDRVRFEIASMFLAVLYGVAALKEMLNSGI